MRPIHQCQSANLRKRPALANRKKYHFPPRQHNHACCKTDSAEDLMAEMANPLSSSDPVFTEQF